jgi:hypothetical protein
VVLARLDVAGERRLVVDADVAIIHVDLGAGHVGLDLDPAQVVLLGLAEDQRANLVGIGGEAALDRLAAPGGR